MYLCQNAAYDYLKTSEISFNHKLISFPVFIQRLSNLCTLISPSDDLYFRIKKRTEGYRVEEEDFAEEMGEGKTLDNNAFQNSNLNDESNIVNGVKPPNNKFDFITNNRGNYSKWKFHKGDADPNPSVPHGHSYQENKYYNCKLDPYRGLIYDYYGQFLAREDRDFIINLWNDDKFRAFVSEALQHFIATNPTYKFRVNSPIVLPRKR